MSAAVAMLPSENISMEELLESWYPVVQRLARNIHRQLPAHVPWDDLVQAGVLGLAAAVSRFDIERAVSFEAYAKLRIRGAILDWLRSQDWVPRSVRRKALALEHARGFIRKSTGEAPTRLQVAERLELKGRDFDRFERDARTMSLLSLDAPTSEDGGLLIDQVAASVETSEEAVLKEERRIAVTDAIRALPERESIAVSFYYLHGLSLKEIGKVLGVSESRVCQLRGRGVQRLRIALRSRFAD